jgi:hypothetical protein
MEEFDILKHVLMPLIIIWLHWNLYELRKNLRKKSIFENGTWDVMMIILWTVAMTVANLRLAGILDV